MGGALLKDTIRGLLDGTVEPVAQDGARASYAPPLKKEDGRIDWRRSAGEIASLVRGVSPWPGAYTTIKGKTLKVHGGRAMDERTPGLEPGTIADTASGSIVVACGAGVFVITELQLENKKRMAVGEFLRGFGIERGEILV